MAEQHDQDLPRDLAAEYVLGVLDAGERVEAQRLAATDPAFAADVAAWQARLAPLDSAYGEEPPPDRVRQAVEARLFGPAAAPQPARFGIGFWRGLAFASMAALAVALLSHVTRIDREQQGGMLIVSLEAADSPVRFLAVYEPGEAVRLRPVSGEPGEGRDFQLWLVEGGAAPVSLGVLPRTGTAEFRLPPSIADRLREEATLAVSLEPAGGSPTGQPTGPVVAAGVAKKI